jgi:hypothetical protein
VKHEDLEEAVQLLDEAIEHANRWAHGRAEDWKEGQQEQANESMERAIVLLQEASQELMDLRPGGLFGGFEGEPERPYLERAISRTFSARSIVGRLLPENDAQRQGLRAADLSIGEAWDIMAAVAMVE